MSSEKEIQKRMFDLRNRTFAMLKMQAGLEGINMVEVVEKAIEQYCNDTVKMLATQMYGEWTERPKKSGRKPRQQEKVDEISLDKEPNEPIIEQVKENKIEEVKNTKNTKTIEDEKIEIEEYINDKEEVETIETTETKEVDDEVLSCYL